MEIPNEVTSNSSLSKIDSENSQGARLSNVVPGNKCPARKLAPLSGASLAILGRFGLLAAIFGWLAGPVSGANPAILGWRRDRSSEQGQPADPTAQPIDDAEAVHIPVEEELKKAAEKLKADFPKTKTKIHRFPERLRYLSKYGRYIVPSVVAIGPYHHRLPRLKKMEEVKKAAAYHFCKDSDKSAEEVYKKILSVSGDARSCYEAAATGMGDADFAAMMFRDGCFLLQYIIFDTEKKDDAEFPPSLESWFCTSQAGLVRDIMLLENQLPWLVLDALMTFRSVHVGRFIANRGASFDVSLDLKEKDFAFEKYKPLHLLALLRFYQSESKPDEGVPDEGVPQGITSVCFCQSESMTDEGVPDEGVPQGITSVCFCQSESKTGEGVPDNHPQEITLVSQSSSAIELAEIGIKLIASKTTRFKDIGVKILGPLYGKFFLAPLVMDDLNACYLVNMVALEECTPDDARTQGRRQPTAKASAKKKSRTLLFIATVLGHCPDDPRPNFASARTNDARTVSSYIFLLAMLMNREEDVHELRVKGILHGNFSDQQTLDFFKNLVKQLDIPIQHSLLLTQLDDYKRKRWVWIAVHKFVYNNFKTIVTVLSVIGVIVGIFQTLLSLKQHQP